MTRDKICALDRERKSLEFSPRVMTNDDNVEEVDNSGLRIQAIVISNKKLYTMNLFEGISCSYQRQRAEKKKNERSAGLDVSRVPSYVVSKWSRSAKVSRRRCRGEI